MFLIVICLYYVLVLLLAQDLKAIYTASSEEMGKKIMLDVQRKWKEIYPVVMNRGEEDWSVIFLYLVYMFSQRIEKNDIHHDK